MTRNDRLDEALRTMDFYELAKITYEGSKNMKIKVDQIKSQETLQRFGNKFFTKEQVKEIRGV